MQRLWDAIEADPAVEIIIDVERRIVEVPSIGLVEPFPLDDATQRALPRRPRRHRHHPVATTTEIDAFEATRPAWLTT